ncbi:craniofacial development protein 2-like [Condylostylus longicornis]|uniref:craniofacial development protein 2-like n=1 Tax=Condylostylus longicornis TaxID=2530218 RepID=UPI00244DDD63|nr:craniofacial development protein 2-like [Condylostylus longicornis]
MKEQSKLAQIEKEMIRYKVKILGLSGIRWPDQGEISTSNNNILLYSGNPAGEHGVGIIIEKTLRKSLLIWKPVSNRIISARLNSKVKKITIVQCYAPTETATAEVKDEFYEQLTSVLSSVPKSDILLLTGDFNAKVGSVKTWPTIGLRGTGTRNNNGERLRDIAEQHGLVIGGTIFPHKEIPKYTWVSPDGRTKNQIDHICIAQRWVKSLTDVRTGRGPDAKSDHMFLTADIKIKLAAKRVTEGSRLKRLDVRKLRTEATKQEFVPSVQQKISRRQNLNQKLTQDIYRQSGEEVLGTVNHQKKEWISDETWAAIEQRRIIRQQLLISNDPTLKDSHSSICRKIKKMARKDKRKFYNDIARDAQIAAEQNNARLLHRKKDILSNKNHRKLRPIKDKNGSLLTSTQEQLRRWKDYFAETNTHVQNTELEDQEPNIREDPTIERGAPTIREIVEAIKKLNSIEQRELMAFLQSCLKQEKLQQPTH